MNSTTQKLISADAIADFARQMDPHMQNGNHSVSESLRAIDANQLFESAITDHEMAACCHAGIWLLHNFLDESHTICQDVDTPEGSYWHAIVHRIEGDFSNAKYWVRRAGQHQVFEDVADSIGRNFDPFAFVDQCQQEYRDGGLSDETQAFAYTEWKALFDYCY